eukprot:TRINITY_DN109550_c0_g1_i1.p1 TRINITY_DN109550_c0_g1~~TRINITY_DN109550_c0_g1_i1.p1  ORF type:complete len:364 (-),score=86.06 TRINITY_DN109550_c0_g1_i1:104-1195(-)
MAGYQRSKAIDAQVYLMGRERQVNGEIMGRQDGDSEKFFPKFSHASAVTAKEVTVNGKVINIWSFSQLESLSAAALRQRAMAIKDAVGEANCPPLPSGRCDDLTRWILQMQEELTNDRQKEGRSGGYGTGHYVPKSFAQETKEMSQQREAQPPVPPGSRQPPPLDAMRDHFQDLKYHQNEFKEAPNLGIQSLRVGGEGKKHLFPKQNMVASGVSAAEPQGIETLKDQPEGRRYIACPDSIMQQRQENEEHQRAGYAISSRPQATPGVRTAAGGPTRHVSENHFAHFGCTDAEEAPIGGERRRHANIPQDHFVSHGTFDSSQDPSGRKYLDGFDKTGAHAGRQENYRSSWKKNPNRLLGSSMII